MIRERQQYQLILELHGFELCGFTDTWIFFNKYNGKLFGVCDKIADDLCSLKILKKLRKRYGMNV